MQPSAYLWRYIRPCRRYFNAAGFTLIELLVVIAIIGLLASIVFASLGGARGKARDARRLSDMHQIQTALEMYANDNGVYPNCTHPSNDLAGSITSINCLQTVLAKYIVVPNDPLYPNVSYTYDQWCSSPTNGGTQYYRLWMIPEQYKTSNMWWNIAVGYTDCVAP